MNAVQKLLFAVLVSGLLGSVVIGMNVSADNREDVSRLLSEGAILPLETFSEQVYAIGFERILDVELESEEGRHIYEIQALNTEGRVREFYFDATTGERLQGD